MENKISLSGTEKDTVTLAHQRYQSGFNYCQKINYYSVVSENEDMYNGDQWPREISDSLPKCVMNIEKRIGEYQISSVASNRIKAVYGIEGISEYPEDYINESEDASISKELQLNEIARMMSGNAEVRWERMKMDFEIRRWLRDGFVTGDMCAHTYWDDSIKTGSKVKGDFVTERVNGGNVFFGNPNERNSQKQPWIIIKTRETVGDLRNYASRMYKQSKGKYGLKPEELELILPDTDTETEIGQYGKTEITGCDDSSAKCNVYLMYFRNEDGIIHWSKSTSSIDIVKDMPNRTGSRYPVDWANWDERENCYHGQSGCAVIHPNQRFINKMFAICMLWMMYNSFGKVAFDATRISGWTNDVGVAIPVQGSVDGVVQQLASGDFNSAVLSVIDKAIQYTKECQGVTDAALGIERADNTSALIIAQKASALPLENQQQRLYQFIEDIFLTWSEYMLNYYIKGRKIPYKDDNGKISYKEFSVEDAEQLVANVKIDVGAGSYWNEVQQMETLEKALSENRITFIQFLESVNNGYFPDRQKFIKEEKAKAEYAAKEQNIGEAPKSPDTAENTEQSTNDTYELEAQFFDGLPEETQQQLQQLSPEEMERQIQMMMMAIPQG